MKRVISVIGGRTVDKTLLDEAEKVGSLIAQKELVLVCGGLNGVMEAVAKGARAAGGITVGILPQEHRREANEYIDIPIVTGLGIGRNVIIARTADVLISIGGEYGTLSEIAFALQMGKSVIGIKTWGIEGVIPAQTAEEAVAKAIKILEL